MCKIFAQSQRKPIDPPEQHEAQEGKRNCPMGENLQTPFLEGVGATFSPLLTSWGENEKQKR